MSDFTLSDGREVDIDLWQLTIKEWRSLRNPSQPEEEEFALISRIINWSIEDIEEIKQPDYELLLREIIKRSINPVTDPNL
jgi:hypothetical protein